ncbi:MAG TPA: nucleoside triphosphate pyrophosphohydrolase [Caulobacteraceae bacterium]|nr:nucleoside triphosphate pyrophosphohydrolase [Caulobacteraceae bacterium]
MGLDLGAGTDRAITARGDPPDAQHPIFRLIEVMAALRDSNTGCPWDLEQTFHTIAPYTIEEAYEVADAIARNDLRDLREELGDLLFQSVYHARLAEEAGAFDFEDVARDAADKMVRRHPHVFGEEGARESTAHRQAWEDQKARERAQKSAGQQSVLAGLPLALPALSRAVKLAARAARVGFDWPTAEGVLDKIAEETTELRHEVRAGRAERAAAELGDLLFACASLAAKLEIDPEAALRAANDKFVRRFGHIERQLATEGVSPDSVGLARLETLWREAKARE